jgi:hypothetical protein
MINAHSNLANALSGLNGTLRPLQGGGFSRASQLVPQVRDHAGLTRFDSSKAATLLNDRMASAAGSALAASAPQSPAGQDGDFSPGRVAQNVLSFIDSAMASLRANGADAAAMEKKMALAQAGVEKGFVEARDILQSFGAWDGKVKENAEKTLDLIHKGFDARRAGAQPLQPAPTRSATGAQSASLAAYDMKRAETFEMEIKTREGDTVRLSYSANQSAGFKASRIDGDGGITQTLSAYSSKSENLSFSVQGDLNDDEKQAIANLMKDVDKLAQDFYGGDMQGAMQHAMALDMNKEQLSSLSLDLGYTQSRSAIAAYRQVGALDQSGNGHAPLNHREVGILGDFNQGLEATLREAGRFFQDADQMVKKLFSDMAPDAASGPPQGSESNRLRDLLEGLIAAASRRGDREPTATPQTESLPVA